MQLQEVGRQRLDDAGQLGVGRIDGERDLLGAAAHARAERARRVEREMARRRREEHEADHVGARVERRVEGVEGGQAADFDEERHQANLSMSRVSAETSGSISFRAISTMISSSMSQ